MSKLIDLLTEGHKDYFPLLVGAMESNSDFAAVIERAIQIEAQRDELRSDISALMNVCYRLVEDVEELDPGNGYPGHEERFSVLQARTVLERLEKGMDE